MDFNNFLNTIGDLFKNCKEGEGKATVIKMQAVIDKFNATNTEGATFTLEDILEPEDLAEFA